MAKIKMDELNILGASDESFDYEDFIEHYFDTMQITEQQKKKRIEAAEELFDLILYFLSWMEEFEEQVKTEEVQRQFENDYKEVVFQFGEPDSYFDSYVPLFINNLIQTTLDHQGEDYFTSVERAANIAANESNSICNYSDIQEALDLGYQYKQWRAELDERTRLDHIHMDGTIIPISDFFVFDDCVMFYPHDEFNGTAKQCVNCRCSIRYIKELGSGAISGAYNDKNDPLDEKRSKIANDLYSQIKNRKKEFEIEAVARNSGFSIDEVSRIYEHVFIRKHLLDDGIIHEFEPDYYMAHSWLRLRTGKNIQPHDLMLLRHELEEEKIMGESLDIPYRLAHNEVEILGYSYNKLLLEYLRTHDV